MPHHALIIDDQQKNITVLGMLLENEGFTYSAVTSKSEVLSMLNQLEKLDVIFLDLELPNGDDYFAVLKLLREQEHLNGVPIVAYTVHTSELDEALRAGFDHFLGKPLDARLFPEQLQRIMRGESVFWVY